MTQLLTQEELLQKLSNIKDSMMPAIKSGMQKAVLNVKGAAKKNCTPGSSPYYKAPYSDDNDPKRDPVHMRDVMSGGVKTSGNSIIGVVGNKKSYAFWVHEGTTRMQARPFIMDAIKAKDEETQKLLSEAVEIAIVQQCETIWLSPGSFSDLPDMSGEVLDE